MVPDWDQLDYTIWGHTMITTLTGKAGEEKEEIYLIGGLSSLEYFFGHRSIWKLKKGKFELIRTQLQYGRAYHIALPISYELAKESCLGHDE